MDVSESTLSIALHRSQSPMMSPISKLKLRSTPFNFGSVRHFNLAALNIDMSGSLLHEAKTVEKLFTIL